MEQIKKYFKGDGVIWGVILLLSLISLLTVYSSTGGLAYRFQSGNTLYYILKHSSFLIISLLILFGMQHIPYKYYLRISQILIFIAIPLLAATLLMGVRKNEAVRWIYVSGLGLTFQTSDLAKISLIMYVSRVLSLKQDIIHSFKQAFLPVIIPIAIVCLLILPANFSTAAILFGTCLILMFIGRIRFLHLMSLVLIGVLLMGSFLLFAKLTGKSGRIGTWQSRIENFVSGSEENYQAEQSKIAIASGSIIGKGPGNSTQRYFLPHPYSDFIYAIIIEEYGLIGGIIVLFLYLFLLYRAGLIVRKCERTFPAFVTIGLTLLLIFQALINMAVAVNLFPVTGQTLPLISMGGTSLLFTSIALGVILSVSSAVDDKSEITETVQDETVEA